MRGGKDGQWRCVERAGGVCEDNKCQHSAAGELSEASVCCLLARVVEEKKSLNVFFAASFPHEEKRRRPLTANCS